MNKKTSMDVLDDLIDYAKVVKHYTIDTESQTLPRRPSIPALLQIEYVYENNPSILLLIECTHLPERNEPTFKKIKQLLNIIFSSGHTIYSWGDLEHELEDFYQYDLFDTIDINHDNKRNIQNEFKEYFNTTYPTSPDIKLKSNETYSLQFAILKTFNEWLTKRFTLGNFGCGLDPALNIIIVPRQFMYMKEQVIQHEEEIRQLLVSYALNDCLGVTKLVNKLPLVPTYSISTTTSSRKSKFDYYEQEVDDTSSSDETDYHVEIHAPNDKLKLNDDDIPDEPKQDLLAGVHVRDEPYEMISDDDNVSLPSLMKLHLPIRQQNYLNESEERVHVQNEPSGGIKIISDQPLTKNQRKNRKKRANRYRFEIIRKIYNKFTDTGIKKILIFMNIFIM